MKLLICGKGGSGKSTVTALLARQHAAAGKRVIVVDTDVSNTGLHRILGTGIPPDLSGYFGGKKCMMDAMKTARDENLPQEKPILGTWTYDTLPKDYSSIKDSIQLVTIGKLRDTSEGCTCPISALARQFILGLTLAENDQVIVDTEAGIEHFGRGIDTLCDASLMVVDPSYESMCMVGKISGMAASVEVPLFFILNKTDAETSTALRDTIPDKSRIIGEFPLDPTLTEAGLEGRTFPSGYPAAAAVIGNVTARLAARPTGE
jgi:CO dehydrogenase maturation factor